MTGPRDTSSPASVTLLLAGDVMTGRGVDQILPHPGNPVIHESYARSALDYVAFAERAHGPIPRPVSYDYVWGDALDEISRLRPDLRLINLETAVTSRGTAEPKGINYRMHPDNIGVLTAARIGACVLANNHALDWGREGLLKTLQALEKAGIGVVGAGINKRDAETPLILPVPGKGRLLVLAFASDTSGIPASWRARENVPGLNLLPDLSVVTAAEIGKVVRGMKQMGDIVIASIHWGGNWGHEIPGEQRAFAHHLIDGAKVDLVHGHSSHHAKAIEVYQGRLILYGCGDLINDYEGIGGYEGFRSNLVLIYVAHVKPNDGALEALYMVPFRIQSFRLQQAEPRDAAWLAETLSREGARLGTRVELAPDGTLHLSWA